MVKRHFTFCHQWKQTRNSRIITIPDLNPNISYEFYMFQLINSKTIGSAGSLHLKITHEIPEVPYNLGILNKSSSSLSVIWNIKRQSQGFITHFSLQINDDQKTYLDTQNTNIQSFTFLNLQPCTMYSLQIFAFNSAGKSKWSNPINVKTNARFGQVKLFPVESHILSWQYLRWEYDDKYNCPVKFRVRLSVDNNWNSSTDKITESNYINLTNLMMDTKYNVKVRPEKDDDIGDFSLPEIFFTKKVSPRIRNLSVSNKNNHFHVVLEIDQTNSIKNILFFLLLSNEFGTCFHLTRFFDQLYELNQTILPLENAMKFKFMKDCEIIEDEKFMNHNILHLESKFSSKNNRVNKSIIIIVYSFNVLGLHKIWNENVYIINEAVPLLFYIFIFLSMLIITIAFIFKFGRITCKKTPTVNVSISPPIRMEGIENNSNQNNDLSKFSRIKEEFKELCSITEQCIIKQNWSYSVATLPINCERNRFYNILPYDHNRVVLRNVDLESDYINASLMPFERNEDKVEYIACQGPLQNTVYDFWCMVWEQNVTIVVMLTKLYEGSNKKCYQYWPNVLHVPMMFNDTVQFSITMEEEKENVCYTERRLVLNYELEEKRTVIHIQMNCWNDFSTPSLEHFSVFLERYQSEIRHSYPVVVHCSAGVGRTGTFLAIDRITRKIENRVPAINIYNEVLNLRRYRNEMVQCQIQYDFIYQFIEHYKTKNKGRKFEDRR